MSGHSKWSTIKRKKGAADAKRGAIFTRLTREIIIAAREGGGDPDSNFSLRLAVDRAKSQNMPKDNIERAIKRGAGEDKDGVVFEEITYEGYAPHGIAMLFDVVTDNRNRAVSEIRHIMNRSGGAMAESGSVGWQFTRQCYFSINAEGRDFDEIFEIAVDAGADDVSEEDGMFEITGQVESFKAIADRLRLHSIQAEDAGLRMVPNHEIALDPAQALSIMRLVEALEELDDIQNVYSNLQITDEVLAAMEA